ncbi:MAG: DUF2062 domain-containing protein [Elainellaceae cyanobacterium]
MRQFDVSSSRLSPPRPSSHQLRQKKQRSWRRKLRYYYHRLLRLEGSPKAIARGLAVGVFAGWFPWFGLQTVVAVALAFLLRGNKVVAAAATWISNPFTYVPIFAFNYHIGRSLLRTRDEPFELSSLANWQGVQELGSDILVPLFFGSFVIGLISASVGYLGGLRFVQRARQQRFARKRRSARRLTR